MEWKKIISNGDDKKFSGDVKNILEKIFTELKQRNDVSENVDDVFFKRSNDNVYYYRLNENILYRFDFHDNNIVPEMVEIDIFDGKKTETFGFDNVKNLFNTKMKNKFLNDLVKVSEDVLKLKNIKHNITDNTVENKLEIKDNIKGNHNSMLKNVVNCLVKNLHEFSFLEKNKYKDGKYNFIMKNFDRSIDCRYVGYLNSEALIINMQGQEIVAEYKYDSSTVDVYIETSGGKRNYLVSESVYSFVDISNLSYLAKLENKINEFDDQKNLLIKKYENTVNQAKAKFMETFLDSDKKEITIFDLKDVDSIVSDIYEMYRKLENKNIKNIPGMNIEFKNGNINPFPVELKIENIKLIIIQNREKNYYRMEIDDHVLYQSDIEKYVSEYPDNSFFEFLSAIKEETNNSYKKRGKLINEPSEAIRVFAR